MVDALEKVWRALRARGVLVDMQPDEAHQPRVAVCADGRCVPAGRISRPPDEDIVAAHRALEAVVSDGLYERVAYRRHLFYVRFDSLAAADDERRSHDPVWRYAPGTRARLEALWREARRRGRIRWTRRFTVAVLRKRPLA